VLLARGHQIFEQLFPNLTEEWIAAGAPTFDHGLHGRTLYKTGWSPRVQSDVIVYGASRMLVEGSIRHRVLKHPRIEVLQGQDVVALVHENDTITGVQLRPRGFNQAPHTISADLIVHSAGRNSRLHEWLAVLGYDQPEKTIVTANVGYSTRSFVTPERMKHEDRAWLILPRPPHIRRGGIMIALENNITTLTLLGVEEDYPPTDEAGFMEFARSLPVPEIYEMIKDATPVGPIHGYRKLENQMYHYDRIKMPKRLLVLGDAYTALNPIYGQGMTVASESAMALSDVLRMYSDPLDEIGVIFQKRLAKMVAGAWMLSTSEDARWPKAQGAKRDPMTRFLHWYLDQVLAVLMNDPITYQTFIQVQHGFKMPTALFQPRTLLRVLANAISPKSRTAGQTPEPHLQTGEVPTL
jgi:2-polyprenyl-6-methoxyphenol hydroxylase-like FAD-dependent oxidoreductase